MNLDELVLKSLNKRPLLREKIKEDRKNKIYSSIENIENLISKRNNLATKIMKSTLLNFDCSEDRKEFKKLEKSIDELLVKNGFSKDYLNKIYVCEKCKDTGYFNNSVCSCIMSDLVEDRVLESGFSNKKREQNFANFEFSLFDGNFEHANRLVNSREYIEKLISFSKEYCDNFKIKDYGAGKTYFASAMVNYMLDKGKRACFITATEFFELMSNYSYSFYRDKKELQDRIDFIRNVDFLVIDDLGNEILSKNNNSFLSSLLDYRIERGLNTIITSNLSEYDLAECYDSRVASRIRGNFKFFVFPPFDLREKIGKNIKL